MSELYDDNDVEEIELRPNSTLDDDQLLRKLKDQYKKDRDHWSDWRDEAEEAYAFTAGEQYSDQEINELKENLRPIITFNRIDPLMRYSRLSSS